VMTRAGNDTLAYGQQATFSPALLARRSGRLPINYTLTFTFADGSTEERTGTIADAVMVELTQLDFSSSVATTPGGININGLQAMIFWAMYNETSEGNFHQAGPWVSPQCRGQGWGTSPQNVREVLYYPYARQNDSCQPLHVMEIQTMLNGILHNEHKGQAAYSYFTDNFRGSLGNEFNPEKPNAYDSVTRIYKLWMNQSCWLSSNGSYQSYANALTSENTDTISRWLAHYLGCYSTTLNATKSAYFNALLAYWLPLINNTIQSTLIQCGNGILSLNSVAYAACDPTYGAFHVRAANIEFANGDVDVIETLVPFCAGTATTLISQFEGATLPTSPGYLTTLETHLSEVQTYLPNRTTYLMPVVFFSRDLEFNYANVEACKWNSVTLSRPDPVEDTQTERGPNDPIIYISINYAFPR
jgi:hypothetical protein